MCPSFLLLYIALALNLTMLEFTFAPNAFVISWISKKSKYPFPVSLFPCPLRSSCRVVLCTKLDIISLDMVHKLGVTNNKIICKRGKEKVR